MKMGITDDEVESGTYVSAIKLLMVKEPEQIYFKDKKLNSAEQVIDAMAPLFENRDREIFVVLSLDAKTAFVAWEIMAVGGTTFCPVDIKNIFKHVLMVNGTAVVCLHNHVSGKTTPSKADYEITNRIRAAADILDIRMLDHIIIGEGRSFFSFHEEGWPSEQELTGNLDDVKDNNKVA